MTFNENISRLIASGSSVDNASHYINSNHLVYEQHVQVFVLFTQIKIRVAFICSLHISFCLLWYNFVLLLFAAAIFRSVYFTKESVIYGKLYTM